MSLSQPAINCDVHVSVVMGAYNAANILRPTIESVLGQSFREFEFIIVNDGSTDSTKEVIQEYASKDSRIVAIHQENQGLTRALIRGCELAKGKWIARVDAGDLSMVERLNLQVQFMESNPNVVAVGGGVRRISSDSEFLGDAVPTGTPSQISELLLNDGIGLSHPSSMFRSDAYRRAGGYRRQFRFAQDTDLWYRLVRIGELGVVPQPLIELRVDTDGISPQNSDRQCLLADLARKSFELAKAGKDDKAVLAEAERVSWSREFATQTPSSVAKANAEHFIGSQLYALGDRRCRGYFWKAIQARPFWLKPWLKLLLSSFNTKTIETNRTN